MISIVDQYRDYVNSCAAIDYGNQDTVVSSNNAVDAMRELVQGKGDALACLLDDPVCAYWLAFQLIELAEPDDVIKAKCLSLIRRIASSPDSPDQLGAKYWLEERGFAL